MIYFVKANWGVEYQVDKEIYDQYVDSPDHTCRVIGRAVSKPVPLTEPVKIQAKWPRKDEKGPWYTLSNGKRLRGKKAFSEQAKLET